MMGPRLNVVLGHTETHRSNHHRDPRRGVPVDIRATFAANGSLQVRIYCPSVHLPVDVRSRLISDCWDDDSF